MAGTDLKGFDWWNDVVLSFLFISKQGHFHTFAAALYTPCESNRFNFCVCSLYRVND